MPNPVMRRRAPDLIPDGIHYDARLNPNAGGRCVVKVPGSGARVGALSDFFTFTGGNQSLYRGAAGLLVQSVTNTPRIEYDASGNLLGLLIEGARTNLALHSGDGTNAAWVKSNMTNAQTSTGPDGVALSATRLTAAAANATILQTVTSASATRAYSVWLRRITGTGNVDLTVDNGTTWTTKTLTTSWARYDISQAAVTNPVFGIRIVTSADAVDFAASQLESAAFPSSYIPTTTVGVARTVDVCTRTFGAEYILTAGTMFAQFDLCGFASGVSQAVSWLDAGGRHLNTISGTDLQIRDGTNTGTKSLAVSANTMYRAASAFDTNGMAITHSGQTVGTASFDGTWGAGTTTLGLGQSGATGNELFGHIRRLSYWPERKSNADLQRLTA